MRDRIGNKLQPGQLVLWIPQGMTVEVAAVDDGTRIVEAPGQAPPEYGMLTLTVRVPYARQGLRPGAELLVPDFIRVVDPNAQAAVEDAVDRAIRPAIIPTRNN